MHPTKFDAWKAIRTNKNAVEDMKQRLERRRDKFRKMCDGSFVEDIDAPMKELPEFTLLDDDGTQKLLTVLEVYIHI